LHQICKNDDDNDVPDIIDNIVCHINCGVVKDDDDDDVKDDDCQRYCFLYINYDDDNIILFLFKGKAWQNRISW
jgi:hypothetical protein